ncbi:MAG: DEAD/DEAH box helicase [Nitrososphaerota archaeon]
MALPYPFDLLDEKIQYWIKQLGFSKPTEIQKLSIEPILKGESVLLISPTGSGKTEAAIFPLLHKLLGEGSCEGVKLLYINPLKALTRDLTERLRRYAYFLNLKVRPLYGDVSKAFRRPIPEIVITTPESLEIILDWASRWWLYFKTIKYVVIDEVHELIFSKRGYQLLVLLERLKQLASRKFQRIGLSATIADADHIAKIFGGSDGKLRVIRAYQKRVHEFEVKLAIPLTQEEMENPFIAGARIITEYINDKKSLIFVASRYSAERLKAEVEKTGVKIGVHHGSIGLGEREFSEDAFKRGLLRAIVATKTLELGIDIGDVEQVIQYRSPGQVNALIQRAGRSLHKPGEKSVCKMVSTDPEDFIECLALINLFNKGLLEKPTILEKPLDVLAKEILGYALHNYKGCKSYKGEFSPIDLETIYATVRKCFLFNFLSKEEFEEVVENLINNKLLITEDKVPYPGPRFWNVWRFEEKETMKWPSLEFREFFSMIPKRETFSVWAEYGFGKRRKLGELDSSFVYRSLTTGMVLRFAGSNWKVSEIDEKKQSVYVVEAKESGEAPIWRGEGPQRNEIVAKEMLSILHSLIKNPKAFSELIIDRESAEGLLNYINSLDKSYIDLLLDGKIIVEYSLPMKTWVFITFLGEKINRTLASAIYEKIIESSLLVKYVVSPIGFAFRSEIINPIIALKSIQTMKEFENLVRKHINSNSPFTRFVKDQIREHFGFPSNEVLLDKEAAKQAEEIYYDLKGALEVFEKIKMNYLVEISKKEISQLGQSVLKYPFERTWLSSLTPILKEALKKAPSGSLDEVIEYTWSNPLEAKEELKKLTREVDMVAFIDLNSKGWSIAKIPLEKEWATLKVPVATRYFVIRHKEDLKKVQTELEKEKLNLEKVMGQRIELTFTGIKERMEEPYSLKIIKAFEVVLDNLISNRIIKKYDKVDLKVHVKRSKVTMMHYGVPTLILKQLIQRDIITSIELLERKIIGGERQVVFEFP